LRIEDLKMSTKTVTIEDAQLKFSELLTFTLAENEVIIVENSKKLARLIPFSALNTPRIAGLNKGKIWTSDDFNTPISEDF
jgi:antitoxin (DNA-binding transcriptional repressor) of toxin-antitoxin stability system